jgi:GR25 family glycosyltransferase involved in LPS biosynthesis
LSEIRAWIQNHPSRAELLPALIKSTGLPTEVVTDDGPDHNPWRGYRLCLERLASSTAAHGVVLQDDVVLCENFGPAIDRIAKANDDTPVVLFLGGLPKVTAVAALKALKQGEHYCDLGYRDFCPAVGMLWPRRKAIEFLEWTKSMKRGPSNPRSDDAVIGYWAEGAEQRIRVIIPSLVQHPDLESIVHPKRAKAGKDKGRVALMFCEGDPLEIDW